VDPRSGTFGVARENFDLSESVHDRLLQVKVYEVLHADLNVEFADFGSF
jgi:hypothetical protein